MKEQMKIQLAWKIIEFLETIADLILEHYIDDSLDGNLMEDSNSEDAWTE
jgi:hypothetical protein